MIVATLSDYFRHRFGFAIFSICVTLTGFGILFNVHNNTNLQYGALFLVTMGTYTAMPIIVCWFNMNLGKLMNFFKHENSVSLTLFILQVATIAVASAAPGKSALATWAVLSRHSPSSLQKLHTM